MKSLKKASRHFQTFQEAAREPGLTALLVIEVVLIFVAEPLVAMKAIPNVVVLAMFVLLVIAILVVTSRSYRVAGVVLVSVVLTPLGLFAQADHPSSFTAWLSAGGRLLALVALSVVIIRAVFAPGRVTVHRVQGAVILYLNFALLFTILYRLVETLSPHAFTGLTSPGIVGIGGEFLYFSFTTLTTAGFGDIVPVHPMARNLANLEAVIGQLYPATLLARLVSLELEHRRQPKSHSG